MTKVFEIKVPAQKKVPVCIKATIHGKVPRSMVCPRIIIPNCFFGTPQVSALLLVRLIMKAENSAVIAQTAITHKIFLIIVFVSNVNVPIENCEHVTQPK